MGIAAFGRRVKPGRTGNQVNRSALTQKIERLGHISNLSVKTDNKVSTGRPGSAPLGSRTPLMPGLWLRTDTGGVQPRIRKWGETTYGTREEVRALLGRRQQLLDQRTQELTRLEKGLQGTVKQGTWCDWRKIWRTWRTSTSKPSRLARSWPSARPCITVCARGMLTAATLIAYVPALGHGSGKAMTALVRRVPWAQIRSYGGGGSRAKWRW